MPHPPEGLEVPPPLAASGRALRRVPHLPAFFPDWRVVPAESAPRGATGLFLDGCGPAEGAGGVHASEAIWRAPRFGSRHAPVALLAARGGDGRTDPVALALLTATPPDAAAEAEARRVMAFLREARIGGAAGLPDPGPGGLGLSRGEAVLVLDPCRQDAAGAARAMLLAARGAAGGRPVLVAESPSAPPGAGPVLEVAERLPGRLSPWTLLDLAQEVHGLGDEVELLALAAGIPARSHLPAAWAGRDAETVFAALIAATRCADPFRARPAPLEAALRQLADWRLAEAENRRIVACAGVEWFKRRRVQAALASAAPGPRILARGSAAIRRARRAGGAVAVWASTMPPCLPARCAAARVPLVRLEDGFIRSAGLGVLLAPASSIVMDRRGIHYDPSAESDLEHLLATAGFDAALLERAARLRLALTARGITKYNLSGAVPPLDLPPGRRVILVPGQVEDDAAIRRSGARIRTNLDLLRAVRAANPDAVLLYKPHPDVEAGMRTGAVPAAEAGRLADRVLAGVPIGPLYGQVQEIHCISSLSGFEGLLRGLRVVTWGRPFYAGWGLTEDRDPPPRRGRPLTLDALVAAALILHPRYIDPVTGLPCPPEILLERLAAASAPGRAVSRVPAPLRALTAAASRRLTAWWAAR